MNNDYEIMRARAKAAARGATPAQIERTVLLFWGEPIECGRKDCAVELVRPGKTQCDTCEISNREPPK